MQARQQPAAGQQGHHGQEHSRMARGIHGGIWSVVAGAGAPAVGGVPADALGPSSMPAP